MTEVLCCQIGSHLVTFLAGGPPLKVGSGPPKNGKEPSNWPFDRFLSNFWMKQNFESKSSPVSSPPNFTGSLTNGHPLSHLGSWTPGWLWPPIAEAVSDPWVHWRSWASNAATSSLANQIPLDPLAGESVRMLGFFRDFYGYSWRKKWVWPACNHPDFL